MTDHATTTNDRFLALLDDDDFECTWCGGQTTECIAAAAIDGRPCGA